MTVVGTGHLAVQLDRVARNAQSELALLLDPFGITPDQWRILEVLAVRNEWLMGELAQAADLHGPTVTKACDRLIEAGLIYRRQDEADRRRIVVFLSMDGRQLLETVRIAVDTQQQAMDARLGPGGAAELADLLDRLLASAS